MGRVHSFSLLQSNTHTHNRAHKGAHYYNTCTNTEVKPNWHPTAVRSEGERERVNHILHASSFQLEGIIYSPIDVEKF